MRARVGIYIFCQYFLKQKLALQKKNLRSFLFFQYRKLHFAINAFIFVMSYIQQSFSVLCFLMLCVNSLIAHLDQAILEKTQDLKNLQFCHWNLNDLVAHDFVKIPMIESLITTHDFDIICLSETCLGSTIPQNDENINGYSLLRVDHPSNSKPVSVCLYYKDYLPLTARNDLCILCRNA